MIRPTRHLLVERRADVLCVRLRSHRLAETEILDTAHELIELARSEGCRGLALSLGPQPPECLYSVLLAKLYSVQRGLGEMGAGLVLCEVDPAIHAIFKVCKLDDRFRFAPDFDAAVAALAK
jgi:hypothetical protein